MDTFLSPRKSLITVGVACALFTAALLTGRTATQTEPSGTDSLTQLQSDPEMARHAPLATKEVDLAVNLGVSSM